MNDDGVNGAVAGFAASAKYPSIVKKATPEYSSKSQWLSEVASPRLQASIIPVGAFLLLN